MAARISKGNVKIGSCNNVSLTPVKSCAKGCKCAGECYARKSYRQYENVRVCWDSNLESALTDPAAFCQSITDSLQGTARKSAPARFRWHVSGDCPSVEYMNAAMVTATDTPETTHLMFTKRYDWALELAEAPANMALRLSAWPGMDLPAGYDRLPVAWMESDERRPADAFHCPGTSVGCEACSHVCWYSKRDVYFTAH